jgi:TATA-box binding protein (TBP) (component of TFIID and TFIIIB)
MSVVDDEWASFLTQGAIILSNEKNSAKNNVTNSYQKNMDSTMTSYTAIIDTAANNVALKPPSDLSTSASAAGNTLTSKLKPSRQTINVSSLKKLDNTIIDDDDIKTNTNGNKYRETKTTLKTKYKSDSDIDECSNSDCEVDDIEVDSIILDDSSLDVPNSNVEQQPVCSNIYISTKTKISYLNEPIDIKKVFWSIPISPYSTPCECIIKKQIKVSTTDPKELEEIKELLKNEKYYQEQEIEHIDNPEGRIKFKVQLKINVGLCKKDILNYRCKLKRAFFNCFVLIMRIRDHTGDGFKEMHIKVFNTGKLEIPGIQTDESLTQVLKLLITILKPIVGSHINFIPDKCETVLINSNFNCGYFINRDKLYNILKYKYRINSNYDACSYPGIQSKFYYIPGLEHQTGQQPPTNEIDNTYEISFMIFRTGSVLIVGRCDENVLHCIYDFLKKILEIEYPEIGNQLNIIQPKKQNVKLRRKVINVVEDI